MGIKFWFDESKQKLMVIHIPSQKRKEIKHLRKVNRFLEAHQVTLEECKSVQEDQDRLGLFEKVRIFRKKYFS